MTVTPFSAQADDSPYCRKVRARAKSDAALLFAPTLRLEGFKLPASAQASTKVSEPTLIAPEWQVRGGVSLSPTDIYKGFGTLDVGDAACEQQVTAAIAEEVLAQDKDYGRLPALKKQIAFLESKRASWEAMTAKSEQLLQSNATSLQETEEIRTRTMAFERQRAQIAGDAARLEKSGAKTFKGTFGDLTRAIETKAMSYEDKVSHVRSLDSWHFQLTGGYVPRVFGAEHADFYGIAQVSFNLGAFWRNGAETEYLAARDDEVKSAPYELTSRIAVFREKVRSSATQAQEELTVLDSRVSALTAGRNALAASDGLRANHALALMDLELIAAESERTYLSELVSQLHNLEEN